MARPRRTQKWQTESQMNARRPAPGAAWQDLREELEILLDDIAQKQDAQMEQNFQRGGPRRGNSNSARQEPDALGHEPSALRRTRQQVQGAHREENRHMASDTRRGLQDAIDQIRSHRRGNAQGHMPTQPSPRRTYRDRDVRDHYQDSYYDEGYQAAAPQDARFDQLHGAVEDITGQIQHLGDMLGRSQSAPSQMNEVTAQIEQLTNIIEALAGRVNEQTAYDGIEQQLVSLARQLEHERSIDFSSIEQRLDKLNQAFEELAMVQTANHASVTNDLAQTYPHAEATKHYASVEEGVRNIYDRLDALEGSFKTPQSAIEQLTSDVAKLNNAIRATGGSVTNSLIAERMDALHNRVADVENLSMNGGASSEQISASINETLGTRIHDLDLKIADMASKMNSRSVKLESSPQLENQLRELTQKLDATSADLEQRRSDAPQMPDLNALAEKIAQQSAQQLRQMNHQSGQETAQMLAGFERKLTDLISKAASVAPSDDFGQISSDIHSVNDRLAVLESMLKSGEPVESAPANRFGSPETQEPTENNRLRSENPFSKERRLHPGMHDEVEDVVSQMQEVASQIQDEMPRAPADHAPLNAPAFPDPHTIENSNSKPVPVPDSLREQVAKLSDAISSQSSAEEPQQEEVESALVVDAPAASADPQPSIPPAPQSSFANSPAPFEEQEQPEISADSADLEPSEAAVDRSTFIAAARRAAQSNNPQSADDAGTSVIGRALSRFQRKKKKKEDEAQETVNDSSAMPQPDHVEEAVPEQIFLDAEEEQESTPRRGRFHLRRKQREEARKRKDQVAFDDEDDLDIVQQSESFLSRHSRPILLGLTVIAVSLMTMNLVSQRMGESTTPTISAQAELPAVSALPNAIETGPDQIAVGSIGNAESVGAMEAADASALSPVRLINQGEIPDQQLPTGLNEASKIDEAMHARAQLKDTTQDLRNLGSGSMPALPEALGPQGLRDAAQAGNANAMFEVGSIYAEGRSVPQDYANAVYWYEQSAAKGSAPAAYFLANMLENGTGIEADKAKALFWYQNGAKAGNRMAMHNLAAMHASGSTGKQNFLDAAFWFERAAALGLADSQFNLGMLHARGLGVKQDFQSAYIWFSLAALSGDADAIAARDNVARSISPEIVTTLQQQIQSWAPQPLTMAANFAPIGTWDANFDPGTQIDNRGVIQRVQIALTRLGYEVGTPDGLMGPKTTEAISAFESATGMNSSGQVNQRLLAVLGSQPI